jgi:hypothetical protein
MSAPEKHQTQARPSCSRDLVACAKKYVEVTFVPPTNFMGRGKKKVVHFPRRLSTFSSADFTDLHGFSEIRKVRFVQFRNLRKSA